MIDLNDLRARPEAYEKACADKRVAFDVRAFLRTDEEYRRVKASVEGLRTEQNALGKLVPKLSGAEREEKLAVLRGLAPKLKEEEARLKECEGPWLAGRLAAPSVPLPHVPVGRDDSENVVVRSWGTPPEPASVPRDHVEVGEAVGGLDAVRGVKVAGSRSYFLKGDLARLQHAVLSFGLDLVREAGYTLMDPPHLVKGSAMVGTGYLPGDEDSAYRLDDRDPDTYLIGTSEVPVCAYLTDELLDEEALPLRFAGYSPCYRREAGTYGRDTHGLYRVHQFYKVEQVVVCRADPDESAAFHRELLGNAERFLQALGLAYRVVDVCTGDMGKGQVFKNDLEAWMPSRGGYGETHSCSTFYDFQSRRLGLRYRRGGGTAYCHTLNNTLVASPRILIPLLETYQTEDGGVRIPEPLRPYMGGQDRVSPAAGPRKAGTGGAA